MGNRHRIVPIVLCLLVLGTTWVHALPMAAPEDVGLSPERLQRISKVLEGLVDANQITGVTALISRHGKVAYFESFGLRSKETGVPMTNDTLFRFYSMSKPITSVAVMTLYEEGRFALNDPVSKYIPQLGGLEVGVEREDPKTGEKVLTLEPSTRDMTVRDLLRHTSGLTYGFFSRDLVDQEYLAKRVLSDDRDDLKDFVEKLGTLPLKYQPGTRWNYSVSVDVLGRFVEVISGKDFDDYLKERILGPLGMTDTDFYVPSNKKERLAALYSANDDLSLSPNKGPASTSFFKKPKLLSGGGGLVSSAHDYWRFCQMMLNGGELDGVRILSRKTVELMTRNHIGGITEGGAFQFGLGFAIASDPGVTGSPVSAGSFSWGGAAHTRFWVDPQEDLIGIFLVQIMPDSVPHGGQFQRMVYQAIDD